MGRRNFTCGFIVGLWALGVNGWSNNFFFFLNINPCGARNITWQDCGTVGTVSERLE